MTLLEANQMVNPMTYTAANPQVIDSRPVGQEYCWIDEELHDKARKALALAELELGIGRSEWAERHLRRFNDLMLRDYCQWVIGSANAAGVSAKPFAKTSFMSPDMPFVVDGPDWLWLLHPAQDYVEPIPPEALRAMDWARANGVDIQGYWIGEPLPLEEASIDPGAIMSSTALNLAVVGGTKTWSVTKKSARAAGIGAIRTGRAGAEATSLVLLGAGNGVAAIARHGLALAVAPVAAVAATLAAIDPVLVGQLGVYPGGRPSGDAVMIELARWL